MPFWRRAAFWQALAGVGFTLAIGAGLVAAEFSATLIHRTHAMSQRIARVKAENRRLESRLAHSDRMLAAMRLSAANEAALIRALTAPNARLIRLVFAGASPDSDSHGSPEPRSGSAGVARVAPTGQNAAAAIVIGGAAQSAVLLASGFAPVPQSQAYRVWWMPRRGSPVLGGEFRVRADGSAEIEISPPPRDAASVAIFAQAASATGAPAGEPILKGALTR
jgi:hypothetical protein